jgi:hypothetical protein
LVVLQLFGSVEPPEPPEPPVFVAEEPQPATAINAALINPRIANRTMPTPKRTKDISALSIGFGVRGKIGSG